MNKTRGLAANPKFHKVMREHGKGELRSSAGPKVTKPEQAQAIAFSEAREALKRRVKS